MKWLALVLAVCSLTARAADTLRGTFAVSATVIEVQCTPQQLASKPKPCAKAQESLSLQPARTLTATPAGQVTVTVDPTQQVIVRTVTYN